MPNPTSCLLLQRRFLERFTGRAIIVHRGFPGTFLRELLEQPGGGGHFRMDARIAESVPPTPIEWVVHRFVLPLSLPLPILIQVDADALYLRHLIQGDRVGHPSEILWMLDSIRERHHARLDRRQGHYPVTMGMPVQDNRIDYDFHND